MPTHKTADHTHEWTEGVCGDGATFPNRTWPWREEDNACPEAQVERVKRRGSYAPDNPIHIAMADEVASDAKNAALSLLRQGGGELTFGVQHVGGRIVLSVKVESENAH